MAEERLDGRIQKPNLEVVVKTEGVSALHVARFVLDLLKTQPELFIYEDLTDWPLPRKKWRTSCTTNTGKKLDIDIESEINRQDVEICVSDGDLRPGDPIYWGEIGYRVDILGGQTAQTYKDSLGFGTSTPAFIFNNFDAEVIISDNWTETITDAKEIMSLLAGAKFFLPRSEVL